MSVGNWREHILVKCKTCKQLMGYHKKTDTAQCAECDIKQAHNKQLKKR